MELTNCQNLEREEYEIVPDSEIVLKRVATADNKSSYFLNEKKSTFSEVRELLQGHHIDLANNRFLILQGEVELISQMKPKAPSPHEDGLLEYIEDIIGSNRLIEEIDKAVEQLVTLNQDRAQQLNRVRAVEQAKDGLEGAKNEAEQFLSLEGEILDEQAVLAQLVGLSHQVKIEKLTVQRAPLEEKLATLRASMADQLAALATLEKEHSQKRKDHAVRFLLETLIRIRTHLETENSAGAGTHEGGVLQVRAKAREVEAGQRKPQEALVGPWKAAGEGRKGVGNVTTCI